MDNLTCAKCGKKLGDKFMQTTEVKFDGESYCQNCANHMREKERQKKHQDAINSVLLSTTNTLQGYEILSYIDIISETVSISEGANVTEKIEYMDENSKEIGLRRYGDMLLKQKLKQRTLACGGNAIVGVQFSFYWTNEKQVSLMLPSLVLNAHGTVVRIQRTLSFQSEVPKKGGSEIKQEEQINDGSIVQPIEVLEGTDTTPKSAIYKHRPEKTFICPVCWNNQQPTRNKCWKCGTQFIFEDEYSDSAII